MEKQNQKSPSFDDVEKTIAIADAPSTPDSGAEENCVASLPVKSQERYKFIRSIGFGGMKGVLLVHDQDTDRDIAMAIMPDFRDRPLRDLNRFVREARLTAKLEHPNIVPVYEIGADSSGSPFFTMKYLPGITLSVILRRLRNKDKSPEIASYTQERLLQILMRVCNAVAFAHSRGICHYDLKPGNIHCSDFGEVQVIDWGLACPADADLSNDVLNGTPGYMAPETISSGGTKNPGKAADIYALGAILYSILTLDSPLAGLPQQEVLRRTVSGQIPPPHKINSDINPSLEAICLKAMALNPADRYTSATELRKEINACRQGFPSKAENATVIRSSMLFMVRNIMFCLVGILSILLAIASYLAYYYYKN